MRTILKIFSVIIFVITSFICTKAQTTCEFSRKNSPILLNLQLGMSPEQTQSVFGKSLKINIKTAGEQIFFQNYINESAPAVLKNVRALYLRFFDKKLYQIEIFYEPNAALPNLESVTKNLADALNFPSEIWKTENSYAEAVCGENSVKADYVLNPRIELTDNILVKKAEEARKNQ